MKPTHEGLRLVSVDERAGAVVPVEVAVASPGLERLRGIRALLSGQAVPAHGEDGASLRPEAAWLLVCLMRQLVRQRWLVRVLEERVLRCRFGEGRDLVDGLEDDEDSGDVPGLAGWRFNFHGRGCCLKGPGELVDVDAYGDAGATIDPYFFTARLFSLASPGFPEARLEALLPGRELVVQVIRELQVDGLLTHPESDHVFRLPPELEALADAADALTVDEGAARERVALLLGDYELLEGHRFADRAWANREARQEWLLERALGSRASSEAFDALRPLLSPEVFLDTCVRAIEGPLSAATTAAIEQLEQQPGADGADAVLRLTGRMSPLEHHPYPLIVAARYLLRRGVERERVVATTLDFARAEVVPGFNGNPFDAEFALLALEQMPDHSLGLVRGALRSSTPLARQQMAAALSVLDAPWCQRELISALGDPACEDLEGQKFLQLALARSQSEWARAVASRWARRRPPLPSLEAGFTEEEVEEANADWWFEQNLEMARAWARRTRVQTPTGVE
ncbi:hypothetical protein LZ198_19415 [Myxococcus sp. K15C18031901]|uniref:DUF6896 domain-containing protein n=1 Tax=Myxococcus dinghuensis TaxID=2906761 RepID=UPI0020A779BE|nr:hypothetical protein [Myxococcus dinghuensis]MCP3101048.1 hypothetical protein [Myxococcus dinghuensis]